jgi:cell division protein FtsB
LITLCCIIKEYIRGVSLCGTQDIGKAERIIVANNKVKKNTKRRFKGSYILIVFALIMVWSLAISFIKISVQIHQREKVQQEVEQELSLQQEENAKLQAVLDGDQGDYMEKIAREELGYGKLGEKFFYNVTPGANG